MNLKTFDKISFWSLFLVVTLLPVFFLPTTTIPVEVSKGLLLVLGLVVCIISYSIARFYDGKIILPKSLCFIGAGAVAIALFLSTVFSGAVSVSLSGTIFDIGSFSFVCAGLILMFMSSVVFRDIKDSRIVLFGVILSGAIVSIFQFIHLFLSKYLSLGVLVGKTGNLIGSWTAFGIFMGFSSLTLLIFTEFFSVKKVVKIIMQVLILLSMFLIAAVNSSIVWGLVGALAFIIFIYKASVHHSEDNNINKTKHFPVFSLLVLVVCFVFFTGAQSVQLADTFHLGRPFGEILPSRLGIQNTEVSPSLASTISVTKSVLIKNPVFGIGPNRFGTAWSMYKPLVINNTQFWDISFNSGSGLLPTITSTTGALGILACLLFIFLFLFSGFRSFFSNLKNQASSENITFFLLSCYLFASSFFYPVPSAIFLLAFALGGMFIGLSSSGEMKIIFSLDHKKKVLVNICLVIVIIVSGVITFEYIENFASVSYFKQTLSAQNFEGAEASINKAVRLNRNDLYLRTYAQVYILKLKSLLKSGVALSDSQKADAQASLDQAVNSAQLATIYDSNNYLNFQLLGSVYETAGSFGVEGAYNNALDAYKKASALNPLNPGLKLSMATTSFASGNLQGAKDYTNMAINLKPDYKDANDFMQYIESSANKAPVVNAIQVHNSTKKK